MSIFSIRELLSGSSVNRPGIRRSINAAMVVEAANRLIPGYLPGMQAFEVVAISFKNGVLRLRVKSAAARHGLVSMEKDLLEKLRLEFPSITIDRMQTVLSKEPTRYELS